MTDTNLDAEGKTTWQLLVDGATFGLFGIQINSSVPVRVCIADEKPSEDANNYMILSSSGTREITTEIASTNKVYIKSDRYVHTAVRGFRKER